MANQLKMAVVHAILTLAKLGWSQRRIAQVLGVDRETVARQVHVPPADSKPATNPIPGLEPAPEAILGSEPILNPIPGSAAAGLSCEGTSSGPESLCEPFRVVIEAKIQQGLTGQRIYQDLVEGHSFPASYSSVRRFLQHLGQSQPLPFRRLEVLSVRFCLPCLQIVCHDSKSSCSAGKATYRASCGTCLFSCHLGRPSRRRPAVALRFCLRCPTPALAEPCS